MSLRVTTRVTGADRLQRKMARIAETLQRSIPSVLKQEARAACVNLGYHTHPFGFSEEPAQKFRLRVGREVYQVYAKMENISAVVAIIRQTNVGLSYGVAKAARAGNEARLRKYLRQAGIKVGTVDRSIHRAARTGPRRSVAKGTTPQAVVRGPSLDKYRREKQDTVGTAKAGWYAAAKSLGGRVRTNTRDASGRRGTSETFPGYVRKVARRYPGLGGSMVSDTRVTIWTNVDYADEALARDFNDIVTDAGDSFRRAIAESIAAAIRGRNRRRAA